MASPLDVKKGLVKKENQIYLPKKIDLAINLIQAFIRNNNTLGLKIIVILAGVKDKIDWIDNTSVIFDVDELCELCGIDRRYLSRNRKKMTETYYEFVNEKGNLEGTRPLHSFEYLNNNKQIRIEVSSACKRLITNLKSKENLEGFRFTQAISKNLLAFDPKEMHKHTLKMQLLLEMINNFTKAKRKYFTIEELNGYFGVNYKRYADIERYILKPIKADLDNFSTITFTYQPTIENGTNKIIGVTIDVEQNDNLFTTATQSKLVKGIHY